MEKVSHTKNTVYEITLRLNNSELADLKTLLAQATTNGFGNQPITLGTQSAETFRTWNELYDILWRRL